jgi:hypothetical protein
MMGMKTGRVNPKWLLRIADEKGLANAARFF